MCIPVTTDPRKRTSHTFTSATGTASNPVRVDGGDCPPNSSFHVRAVDRRPCCDTALKLRASPDSRCRGSHPAGGGAGRGVPAFGALTSAVLARTRVASGWVLRATMSSSCRWSALTAGSPDDGSGLSAELVLEEEPTGSSLRTGKTRSGHLGARSPLPITRARDTRGGRGLGLKTLCPAPPASCTPHPGRAGR